MPRSVGLAVRVLGEAVCVSVGALCGQGSASPLSPRLSLSLAAVMAEAQPDAEAQPITGPLGDHFDAMFGPGSCKQEEESVMPDEVMRAQTHAYPPATCWQECLIDLVREREHLCDPLAHSGSAHNLAWKANWKRGWQEVVDGLHAAGYSQIDGRPIGERQLKIGSYLAGNNDSVQLFTDLQCPAWWK